MNEKYSAIINLPHQQSKTRKHMTMEERAAQFGAFRALTGYEDAIAETGRLTDEKLELDEYAKMDIDEKLRFISDNIDCDVEVSITFFVPDEKKSGGAYITKRGIVTKIREYERQVVFEDKTEIKIDDILAIELKEFDDVKYGGERVE